MEAKNASPLGSRLFLISALIVVCLTTLIALGKLQMESGALIAVLVGILGTIAGLSRRATDLQPKVTRGPVFSDAGIAALAQSLPELMRALSPTGASIPAALPAGVLPIDPTMTRRAVPIENFPGMEDMSREELMAALSELFANFEVYATPKSTTGAYEEVQVDEDEDVEEPTAAGTPVTDDDITPPAEPSKGVH